MDDESPITVGDEKIDAEHRQVLRRVRQIAAAVAGGRGEEVASALKFLHHYLGQHFVDEERWMSECGYPGLPEHSRIHAVFLAAIADARRVVGDDLAELSDVALDLSAKLEEHMRTEDVKIARFSTARANLRLLAESGPGVGVSLTPLPGTHPAVPAAPERDES